MRVPLHVVEARRRRLAELLQRHRYSGLAELCKEFGVSEATMRRDLVHMEKSKLITRTYGGAMADFNLRFPSFKQRRNLAAEAKRSIAQAALKFIRPELTLFLDNGTTVFALTEALRDLPIRPLTCVTGNLPVADLLSEVEGLDVHLLGGQVLRRQSVLLGDAACYAAERWSFDLAFLSAQGMTREGIWNSEPSVVALQRAVISRTRCNLALLDSTKLGRTAPQFLGGWTFFQGLLTDATTEALDGQGIPILLTDIAHISKSFDEVPDQASKPILWREDDKTHLTLPTSLL